jgi:hypothetical protein
MERPAKRPAQQARQYHVVLHDSRWWIEDNLGAGLHAASDLQDAVTWAIRRAQHDQADGLDAMVCVEQPDGSWKMAWHS